MENELSCHNLTKSYDKTKALDNVSFRFPAKGIFALIGRNGAGKTTLIRILSTALMPTSGTAMIDGIDVIKNPAKIREQIAILPQESRAIQWLTPRESIISYLLYRGFSIKDAKARVPKSLKALDIKKYENTPNRMLSGGIKRKVLLSMILASEAKILFIDEPTTGLDPLSRSELWSILDKIKKDRFIFLTTHYLEEAERLADRIGILNSGKLVGFGTLEELRNSIKYHHSIRVLQKGVKVRPRHGKVIVGEHGFKQILTSEEEADRLAKQFIQQKVKFSINPISLDEIFYYIVKKPIESEEESNEEDW
jgi:ABC-2 type transport system ATP-binding protein